MASGLSPEYAAELERRLQYLAAQQAAAQGRDAVSSAEIVADIVR